MNIITRVSDANAINPDGTNRQDCISSCKVGEKVKIKPHPVNRHLVMVETQEGKPLGHLPEIISKIVIERLETERKYYLTGSILERKNEAGSYNLMISIAPNPFPYWILTGIAGLIILALLILLI